MKPNDQEPIEMFRTTPPDPELAVFLNFLTTFVDRYYSNYPQDLKIQFPDHDPIHRNENRRAIDPIEN